MRLAATLADIPAATPVTQDEFDRLMAAFGPFEPNPRLAVAVSGGSDSMALCRLACRWAADQNGHVLALTVDHQLRPGSGEEAMKVGSWLTDLSIDHRVLRWTPDGSSQNAAREGRYRLLQDACRDGEYLHLLVGHTADDQAETVALRQSRGSGADGLAGMAAVRELDGARILRPLLGVRRNRLKATLDALSQVWIDDPTNADDRFARSKVRKRLTDRPLEQSHWTERSTTEGRNRRKRDGQSATALAATTAVYPEGYATVDLALLRETMAPLLLARIVRTVRGAPFAPSADRMARICADFVNGARSRTIGGCRIVRGRRLTIVREHDRVTECVSVKAGQTVRWDDRFFVTSPLDGQIGCLGDAYGQKKGNTLPVSACKALPALWHDGAVIAWPDTENWQFLQVSGMKPQLQLRFRPQHPVAGAAHDCMFGVV